MSASSISSEVARAAAMCFLAAALMAMTFDIDRLPVRAVCGVSLGGLLVKARFGMSAPKAENGFAGKRIVSSQALRRNIRGGNAKDFNMRKMERSRRLD